MEALNATTVEVTAIFHVTAVRSKAREDMDRLREPHTFQVREDMDRHTMCQEDTAEEKEMTLRGRVRAIPRVITAEAVSYTHLTLPTIYSV